MNSSDSPVPVADPTSSPKLPSNGPEKPTFSESELLTAAPPSEAVSDVLVEVKVGGTLGGYRLLKKLGEGGMGFVFEAEDARLKRHVAMKVMKPDVAVKDALRHRFLREAQAAAAVEHDYIVPILQVGEEGNVPFIVMPFLKGEPLDARLKRGRLDIPEIITFGRQTAEGLAAAHEHGLIHRDIKPANIWLETTKTMGTRVRILDFGLARISGDEAHLTQSGAIMGTPAYMAPEQARGWEVDARADLFSLGCVLYEMCTGKRPFTGSDAMAVLSSLALDTPTEPIKLNPQLPPALSQIIVKLLEKDPAKRPASAKEVAEALKKLMPETTVVVIATKEKTEEVSPWANIDASSTEIAPPPSVELAAPKKSAGEGRTVALTPVAPRAAEPGKSKMGLLIGGGLLGLAALIAVIVIIRDKDGNKVAKIKVPGGGSVEIKDDGGKKKDPIAKVEPNKDTLPNRFKNALGMEFALVPKGKSWLGGGNGNPGNKEVVIAQDFYLGVYEVMQEEWEKVTGLNPSFYKSVPGVAKEVQKRFPVDSVSWDDCQLFIKKLNEQAKEAGWEYRLPTEVEWEYACRGGPMKDQFESGFAYYLDKPSNTLLSAQANCRDSDWKRPCKVGSYLPNRLGLYDMHGNVLEWCQDEAPADPKDPKGASKRVARGGSWFNGAEVCTAGSRHLAPPSKGLSLRVARIPVGVAAANRFTNTLGMEFALVPKGKSWLGGGKDKPGDKEVVIAQDFYLGVYEVTQEEWEKVTELNPSHFKSVPGVTKEVQKRFPVENVSWDECQAFIKRLNEQVKEAGWEYRLPTEVEWEYACRGGPMKDQSESGFDYYLEKPSNTLLPAQANFKDSDLNRPCKVGSYLPNRLGLYDMHGNVWEWCQDEAPADPKDPKGASRRVHRGGSWAVVSGLGRAVNRDFHTPSHRNTTLGLRLARVPVGAAAPNRFTNALGMEFALVPKGKSWLGGGKDKLGVKEVVIAQDFYLGVYEVTQEEWVKVMEENPSAFKSVPGVAKEDQKRFPVENVSWDDCQAFIKKLNERTREAGWKYRLPTEEEWEYACRGGPMKDQLESGFDYYLDKQSNTLLPAQANFKDSDWKRSCQVGSYPPNRLGLYDMHGNVWEWCQDEVPADPKDPKGASRRVYRGGGWNRDSVDCRAAHRFVHPSSDRYDYLSLRVARVPVGAAAPNRFTNALGMEFALVPKGTSWLGGSGGKPGDKEVVIPQDFYLGVYVVTQEEWEKVTGLNPSQFKSVPGVAKEDQKRFPVDSVTWEDCRAFVKRLNGQVKEAGWEYRLPTEAEWEYACRGALSTKYAASFDYYLEKPSNTLLPEQANFNDSALKRTCKVGSYPPNRLGLYDMHGNVFEWCQDELPADPKDPKGASRHVGRGGCWSLDSVGCRVANRFVYPPSTHNNTLGLRLARVPSSEAPVNPPPFVLPTFDEKEAKKQQEDWSAKLKLPVEATSKLGMKMILIPPAGAALPKAYYLGKYEVTQGQWEKVMVYNPSQFGPKNAKVAGMDTSKFPVEMVSWFDSVEFCNKLSEQEGLKPYYDLKATMRGGKENKQIDDAEVRILGGNGYHIPTDAEWTHGCAAGSKTKYHFGDKDDVLPEYAWFDKNCAGRTHAVGEKRPNAFGLYDMHGNVREWNEEMLTNATTGAPERVYRGGNWSIAADKSAVSERNRHAPGSPRYYSNGLRVARVP